MSANIRIVPLPAKCPELNPVENVWQYLRNKWLSNRTFRSCDAIVDHWCEAWNRLADHPECVMSLGLRQWLPGHPQWVSLLTGSLLVTRGKSGDRPRDDRKIKMRHRVMLTLLAAIALGWAWPTPARAIAIILPTPFVAPVNVSIATPRYEPYSFVYAGTLTGSDTLSLTATGGVSRSLTSMVNFFNAAGVSETFRFNTVTYASSLGDGTYVGALLLTISGIGTHELLYPSAATGLGQTMAVSTVTLPSTSLSNLGFGTFSVTNPTLAFSAAAGQLGSFIITQDASVAAVPEPGSLPLLAAGLAGLGLSLGRRKSPTGSS